MSPTCPPPFALDRLAAWQIALRAENKSPGTVTLYTDGTARYLRWCAEHEHLPMRRASLNQWIADLLDAGAAPGTARIRQQAVRRFGSWLTAGGELDAEPFPGVKAPHVEPPLVEPLTDDELRALIAACAAPDVRKSPRRPCTTAATRPSSGPGLMRPLGTNNAGVHARYQTLSIRPTEPSLTAGVRGRHRTVA
jgi:hypothetical protein